MKPSKCVVFDCNALVSALIRNDSVPALAFDRARKHCDLVTSVACIFEMRRIFYKEKFALYFTREEADLFLEVFQQAAIVVEPTGQLHICRDPQDDKYLEAAVAAQADVIVSGDPDLLVLHPFREIAILSPRDFLDFPI